MELLLGRTNASASGVATLASASAWATIRVRPSLSCMALDTQTKRLGACLTPAYRSRMERAPSIRLLVIALGLLFCTAAQATPPFYDPGAYCRQATRYGGEPNQSFGSCYRQEQDAFNRIKLYWDGLAVRSRAYCDGVAESVGSSYQMLERCLQQQVSGGREQGSKQPGR